MEDLVTPAHKKKDKQNKYSFDWLDTDMGKLAANMPQALLQMVADRLQCAVAFVRMLQVCKDWHTALLVDEESTWEMLTLARFPRMQMILRLSSTTPVESFRALYRSQLEVESKYSTESEESTPDRGVGIEGPSWKELLFTVELWQEATGVLHAAWAGSLMDPSRRECCYLLMPDCTPFRMPKSADGNYAVTRMRIFLTWRLKTLKLFDGCCEEIIVEHGRAATWLFDYGGGRQPIRDCGPLEAFIRPEFDGQTGGLFLGLEWEVGTRHVAYSMDYSDAIEWKNALVWPKRYSRS
jgi:hypothetical protein